MNIGACSIIFCCFSKSSRRKSRDPFEILAEKRGRGKIQVIADFRDPFLARGELRLRIHDDATLYPVGGTPPRGFHDDPRKVLGTFAELVGVIRQVAMAAVFHFDQIKESLRQIRGMSLGKFRQRLLMGYKLLHTHEKAPRQYLKRLQNIRISFQQNQRLAEFDKVTKRQGSLVGKR